MNSMTYPTPEARILHIPHDAVIDTTPAVPAGLLIEPTTLARWARDDAPPAVSVTDTGDHAWLIDYCHNAVFLSDALTTTRLSGALDGALDALHLADLVEAVA